MLLGIVDMTMYEQFDRMQNSMTCFSDIILGQDISSNMEGISYEGIRAKVDF